MAEDCRRSFEGHIEYDERRDAIFSILQRDGRGKVFTVEGRVRGELLPLIQQHTPPDSHYHTDARLRGSSVVSM